MIKKNTLHKVLFCYHVYSRDLLIVSIKKGCPKIQEQTPGFYTTNLGHDISDFRKCAYLTENTQFSSSSYGTKGYFLETPHYNINYV